jgi:hypothetical protein
MRALDGWVRKARKDKLFTRQWVTPAVGQILVTGLLRLGIKVCIIILSITYWAGITSMQIAVVNITGEYNHEAQS